MSSQQAQILVGEHALRRAWLQPVLVVVTVTVGAWGVAATVGRDEWTTWLLAAGGAVVMAVAWSGEVAARREQLRGTVTASLVAAVGAAEVTCRWWTPPWWVGTPRSVRIQYRAEALDDRPASWSAQAAEVVGRRLAGTYRVGRHDRRRLLVWLTLVEAGWTEGAEDEPDQLSRPVRVVRELLGETAAVTVIGPAAEPTRLEVTHQAGVRAAAAGYRLRVERTVSVMLPGRWRAHWDMEGDGVVFEQRPTLPGLVPHPVQPVTESTRMTIPVGVDEDGRQVVWNLSPSAVQPHGLVVGTTGAGKTKTMLGIILELSRRGFKVAIIDPKRIEFLGVRDWPNVAIVATRVEHMIATLASFHRLMEERYRLIEEEGVSEDSFEPAVLVMDEYRNFLRQVTAWYATMKERGMPAQCPALEMFFAIAEKGRSAHVHLLTGTQRPDAAILAEGLRDLFGFRVAVSKMSPQGAMMMWDNPTIGVALPKGQPGRAIAMSQGEPSEVQIYWTPDPRTASTPTDRQLLANLAPVAAVHERLVVQPPPQPTYAGWVAAELVPADSHPDLIKTTVAEGQLSADSPDLDPASGPANQGVEYGEIDHVTPPGLTPGDLVLLDEAAEAWGVVEACEPDITDDNHWCVDWRDDSGEIGSLSLDADDLVQVRHPVAAVDGLDQSDLT